MLKFSCILVVIIHTEALVSAETGTQPGFSSYIQATSQFSHHPEDNTTTGPCQYHDRHQISWYLMWI